MKKEEVFTQLFLFSAPTFYNWQREKRPIIVLLDQYCSKEDLEEFLETGKIQKMEELNYLVDLKKEIVSQYANIFYQLFYELASPSGESRKLIINLIEQCAAVNTTINDVLESTSFLKNLNEVLQAGENNYNGLILLLDELGKKNQDYKPFGLFQKEYGKFLKRLSNFTSKNMEEIRIFKNDIVDELEKLLHTYYIAEVNKVYSKYFNEKDEYLIDPFYLSVDEEKHWKDFEVFLKSWEDHAKLFNDKSPYQIKYEKWNKEYEEHLCKEKEESEYQEYLDQQKVEKINNAI